MPKADFSLSGRAPSHFPVQAIPVFHPALDVYRAARGVDNAANPHSTRPVVGGPACSIALPACARTVNGVSASRGVRMHRSIYDALHQEE